MKKKMLNFIKITVIIYSVFCTVLYLFQEKLIFFPEKLGHNYEFKFDDEFEEVYIEVEKGVKLSSALFKAKKPKGLIFYLHGNSGSLKSWGDISKTYTDLGYDLFILDYRGFGKSDGDISGQNELFSDVQKAYNLILKRYVENEIVILGYSIGTGLAAKLASMNNAKQLILQAPYFSMVDMMRQSYPICPTFLLKYKLESNKYISACNMPIVLFHGREDNLIDYEASLRLRILLKSTDELILLDGQGHNGMTDNVDYKRELKRILN